MIVRHLTEPHRLTDAHVLPMRRATARRERLEGETPSLRVMLLASDLAGRTPTDEKVTSSMRWVADNPTREWDTGASIFDGKALSSDRAAVSRAA